MKNKIKIGNKDYLVEVQEFPQNVLKVMVNGKDYFFTKNELGELVFLEDFKPASLRENGIILEGFREKEIKTPLAGTVSLILVKKEDKVKPGQKVATLIAMKMENEIIAEGYGRVKDVKVKENQFVNAGDTLILLE